MKLFDTLCWIIVLLIACMSLLALTYSPSYAGCGYGEYQVVHRGVSKCLVY